MRLKSSWVQTHHLPKLLPTQTQKKTFILLQSQLNLIGSPGLLQTWQIGHLDWFEIALFALAVDYGCVEEPGQYVILFLPSRINWYIILTFFG